MTRGCRRTPMRSLDPGSEPGPVLSAGIHEWGPHVAIASQTNADRDIPVRAFAGRDGRGRARLGRRESVEDYRYDRAFNLKAAYSFPEPDEVESADFEIPWTINDGSVRPIAEKLIRVTGGTPVYEGNLENAREY